MTVDTSSPAATLVRDGETFYFCSLRCRDKFDHEFNTRSMREDVNGDQIDPVCSMHVASNNEIRAVGADGLAYYFCSEDCQRTFLEGPRLAANQQFE
jgi:YHS domain-containing protein